MALDAETKKLFAGDQWAIDGDRLDVDSSDDLPVIARNIGFQGEFSTTKTLNREKLNQIICELSGAAKVVREGIPAYDATVSYPPGSVVKVNGEIYHQGLDVASTGVTPTTLNNGVWSLIAGVSQDTSTKPPALSSNDIIIDGTRADRFNVRLIIADTGGHPITRIDLQYSKSSNFSSGVSTENNYTQGEEILISYRDSDAYYVRVRLYNTLGQGNWSNGKKVGSALSPEGPYWAQASHTPNASGSVDVSWGGTGDNGLTISKHVVEYKQSTAAWSAASTTDVANTNGLGAGSTTITSLTDGTAYDFRVVSHSNRSTTTTSPSASATPVEYPLAPAAPSVGGSGQSVSSVIAYITGDTANNGSAITGYKWTIRTPGGNWASDVSTALPYHIFTGLTANTSYEVRAKAVNSIGDSTDGTTATVSTLAYGTPGTPAVQTVRTNRTTALYFMYTNIDNTGGSSITKYKMQYKVSTEDDTQWGNEVETSVPVGYIQNLGVKTTYDLRFSAYNGTNWSDYAETTIAGWVAFAPSNVSISVVSGGVGKAVVSLGTTINDGGDPVTSYKWEYKRNNTNTWTTWRTIATPYDVITNLIENAAYDFRVTASNSYGSTESSPVEFTIETDDLTPVLNGDITSISEERRGIFCPARIQSNGNPITSFQGQVRKRAEAFDQDWNSWMNLSTKSGYPPYFLTSQNLPGDYELERGWNHVYREWEFQVRVRAVNSNGNSDWVYAKIKNGVVTQGE